MLSKLGTAILLLFILSTASADELVTYLIHTHSETGDLIQGAAFTDSDQWEVDGFIMLQHDAVTTFSGMWTRMGTIEAVDSNGEMYMFNVIRVLHEPQSQNLTDAFVNYSPNYWPVN